MGNLRLYGSTSGYVEIAPPAVGSSQVLTLPTDSVQPGLVLVNKTDISAASSVSVNNCFSSTYDNYRIVFSGIGTVTATTTVKFRLRASGSDTSAGYYLSGVYGSQAAGPTRAYNPNTSEYYASEIGDIENAFTLDVFRPQVASTRTSLINLYSGPGSASSFFGTYYGYINNTGQFDGFTLFVSSGTFTGTIRVYGYRNS